jgi:hypothetical protein
MHENRLVSRIGICAIGLGLATLLGCSNASDLVESTSTKPSDEESARTQPTNDKPDEPGEPEVDACHRLSVADIEPATNDDPAVPCTKPHTAVTYYVGEWPKRLVKKARGVGDRQLTNYVYDKCDRRWRRTVGGSLEAWTTSIVSWAWYKPTKGEFADGAHWFRCDLVAGQHTGRLEKLPRNVDGLLDGDFSDRYRACWTREFSDKPNVDEGVLTSCARNHQQRAVGIVRIGKRKAPYPGERKAFDRSNDRCGDVVAQWRGDPKPGEYGLQWPRREHWKDGDRHATCWAVTTK